MRIQLLLFPLPHLSDLDCLLAGPSLPGLQKWSAYFSLALTKSVRRDLITLGSIA